MANIKFLESGSDATQGLEFYSSPTGTIASDNSAFHTGKRSIKFSTGAGAAAANHRKIGILADTGRRISIRFKFDTTPAGAGAILGILTSGGSLIAQLQQTTANKLNIVAGGTAQGSTVLVAGTWYRLTFVYTITSTTTFTFKVFLNGSLEATVNTGTLPSVGSDGLRIGIAAAVGANANYWVDDVYIDDGSTLDDPGNVRVTNKRPVSNGTTNGFTTQIGSGSSSYGSGHAPQVNEQPLSTTDGWSMIGAGNAVTEEYTVESSAVGDVDLTGLTILGYMGWLYASTLVAETGQIVVGGSSSNISLTSSNTLFVSPITSASYPGGGTDIGIVTDTSLTTVSLYEAGLLIAYISGAGSASPSVSVSASPSRSVSSSISASPSSSTSLSPSLSPSSSVSLSPSSSVSSSPSPSVAASDAGAGNMLMMGI